MGNWKDNWWRYVPNMDTTAVNCDRDYHCLHKGTPIGSPWCCKCGQYIDNRSIAEKVGFYKEVS